MPKRTGRTSALPVRPTRGSAGRSPSRSTTAPTRERFAFVPEAAQPEALALLEDATHLVLDAEEAAHLGAAALSASDGDAVPVLLRGLVVAGEDPHADRFPPDFGLQILWADGSARVEFVASRLRHEPDVRRPVVALLPRAPAAVYTVSSNVIVGGVRPPE